MNEFTIFNNNKLTVSSIEIATLTGKRHDHVLRDIYEQILKSLYDINFKNRHNLVYGKIQGLTVIRDDFTKRTKEILLDRYHADILVSGYEVKYRAAIAKRWRELQPNKPHSLSSY